MRVRNDPVAQAWRRADYYQAAHLMECGHIPSPGMLRKHMAPGSLGPALRALGLDGREDFLRALSLLALSLGPSLSTSPDTAGQMRANDSLLLMAATLCDLAQPRKPLARMSEALESIMAWEPRVCTKPARDTAPGPGSHSKFTIAIRKNPLWTQAGCLDAKTAHLLIEGALDSSGSLDAQLAWSSINVNLSRSGHPTALRLLATHAKAPSPKELDSACVAIAYRFLGFDSYYTEHQLGSGHAEWPSLAEFICTEHAPFDEISGASLVRALLGFCDNITSRRGHRFSSPGEMRALRLSKENSTKALAFLDWLEACAMLSARLGLPDLGPQGLPEGGLEFAKSYAGLSMSIGSLRCDVPDYNAELAQKIINHPFPLGYATISEAFDARKGSHAIALALSEPIEHANKRRHAL